MASQGERRWEGKIMWQNTEPEFMCECVWVCSYMCSGTHACVCSHTELEAGVRSLPQLIPTLLPQTGSLLNLLLTDLMGLDWLAKGEHDQNTLNEIAKKLIKRSGKSPSGPHACVARQVFDIWGSLPVARLETFIEQKKPTKPSNAYFYLQAGAEIPSLKQAKLGSECPWPTASSPSHSSSSSTEDLWMFL